MKLPPERLVALYRFGFSVKDCAAMCGWSRTGAAYHIEQSGAIRSVGDGLRVAHFRGKFKKVVHHRAYRDYEKGLLKVGRASGAHYKVILKILDDVAEKTGAPKRTLRALEELNAKIRREASQ